MSKRNIVLLIIIALAALAIDQLSKYLIVHFLKYEGNSARVLGNFLVFVLTYNPHGVFGLKLGHGLSYLIMPVLGILLVIFFAGSSQHRGFTLSYGLILGGAFGNLIDRIFRPAGVVDFISVGLRNWRWYTFNLADTWLIVGIILLLLFEMIASRKPKPAPLPDSSARATLADSDRSNS